MMNTCQISGFHTHVCRSVWLIVALIALQVGVSSNSFSAESEIDADAKASKGGIPSNVYFEQILKAPSSANRMDALGVKSEKPQIGLALAGGGTRASQISIGVLKGLHESGILPNVTHLSTVSGGGYAGYWYVSQRMNNSSNDEMFADCIPSRYTPIVKTLGKETPPTCTSKDAKEGKLCLCPHSVKDASGDTSRNFTNVLSDAPFGTAGAKYSDPYRFQNSLRGHTDLFAPTFSYADTRKDKRFFPSVVVPLVYQVATALTIDAIGDVLFDWNINTSPSRYLYRDGIRRIYGQPPLNCADYLNKQSSPLSLDKNVNCMDARPLVDEVETDQTFKLSTFDAMRRVKSGGASPIPNWVINATTPVLNCPHVNDDKFCANKEFFSTNSYPAHKATFEFTPDFWGSGEFGYWPVSSNTNPFADSCFDLINAVSSSAAFFDPNEKSLSMGGTLNILQQITGFKWGYYLRNPNVSQTQRVLHRGLFFPFYLAHKWRETKDAVDIHLIDGGQSDNLGAYALIRRRIPNIIISDHAGEVTPGNMEDICQLKKALGMPEFAASNGGKIWQIQFNKLPDLPDVCSEANTATLEKKDRKVYNVWNWKNPVLEGCAVEIEIDRMQNIPADASCESLKTQFAANDASRYLKLFLIKSAIDLTKYLHEPYEQLRKTSQADIASATEIVGFIKNNLTKTDHGALIFPTHGTVNLTIDSSPWLFGAYRELAAQATRNLSIVNGTLIVDPNTPTQIQKSITVESMEKESKALTESIRFNK